MRVVTSSFLDRFSYFFNFSLLLCSLPASCYQRRTSASGASVICRQSTHMPVVRLDVPRRRRRHRRVYIRNALNYIIYTIFILSSTYNIENCHNVNVSNSIKQLFYSTKGGGVLAESQTKIMRCTIVNIKRFVMYNVSICLAVCGHVGVATQASGVLFITPRGTCVRVRADRVSRMLLVDSGGRV